MVDAANRAMIGKAAILRLVSEAERSVNVSFHPTLIVELCL